MQRRNGRDKSYPPPLACAPGKGTYKRKRRIIRNLVIPSLHEEYSYTVHTQEREPDFHLFGTGIPSLHEEYGYSKQRYQQSLTSNFSEQTKPTLHAYSS